MPWPPNTTSAHVCSPGTVCMTWNWDWRNVLSWWHDLIWDGSSEGMHRLVYLCTCSISCNRGMREGRRGRRGCLPGRRPRPRPRCVSGGRRRAARRPEWTASGAAAASPRAWRARWPPRASPRYPHDTRKGSGLPTNGWTCQNKGRT